MAIDFSARTITPADSVKILGHDGNGGYTTGSALKDYILSGKGNPNGLAELDENGKLVQSQLPDLANDVLEYDSCSVFPVVGETGKIYVDKAQNTLYRWDGTQYTSVNTDTTELEERVDSLETDLEEKTNELKGDLVNIDNALSSKKPVGFDSVENGKVYNRSDRNGVSLGGYDSYHKNVDENKVYYISTTVVGTSDYSAVLFYGNDGYIGASGDYETVGGSRITDYEFKPPIGTTEIIVTIANWVAPPRLIEKEYIYAKDINVNKFAKNFVKVEDGVVSIKAKYNATSDICFVFKKRGGNNLVDFDKVFTVGNASSLNDDFTVSRTIFNNSTDFFSPHIVSADTNRDGDNINSYYFTGGNHKTTNTDIGGGVTANTTSFNVYADEMSVPQNGCYCNKVVLDWVNDVQAFNTSRADGSGRAVLEEHITLSIVGNKINCKITHKAKEPIKRLVYYGLQALTTAYNTVRFIGGTNRKLYPTVSNETQLSGGTNCRDIQIASTNGDIINIHIDNTDLGDFANCEKSFSAFNSGYGKSYFNVIMHEETPAFAMDTGDMTETCGYYEFASTN